MEIKKKRLRKTQKNVIVKYMTFIKKHVMDFDIIRPEFTD
jgi:hypothetical protein